MPENESPDNHQSAESTGPQRRGYGELPNEVVRDERLSPAALVLLAWRSTFAGDYVTREQVVAKIVARPNGRGGFSKSTARPALATLKAAGYLDRTNTWSGVTEQLTLPSTGNSGRAFRRVYRTWFNGQHRLDVIAAYLYVRAGAGLGQTWSVKRGDRNIPGLVARQVAQRFGWTQKKASGVLTELVALGAVTRHQIRERGAFKAEIYSAGELPDGAHTVRRSTGRANNGQAISGQRTKRTDSYEESLSSRDSETKRTCTAGAVRAPDELRDEAFADERLLGWLVSSRRHDLPHDLREVDGAGAIAETIMAGDRDALRQRVSQACRGRIGEHLLTDAGLYGFAYLAGVAALLDDDGSFNPWADDFGINALIAQIEARIGSHPGEWLNSWQLLGLRMSGQSYTWGTADLYADARGI